ncbi:MAG: acyltransferase family protein [Streptosporangiaceae bacterium]
MPVQPAPAQADDKTATTAATRNGELTETPATPPESEQNAAAGTPTAARGTPPAAASAPAGTEVAAPARKAFRAPGLDGVRALAVLAVLAFHESLPWLPGGFLGVDVFFVLSGYLITDILVGAYQRNGTIGLAGFWQRRARRLLPPLAVVLVAVTATVAITEPDQLPSLRTALLGAVTYTSNWWQALTHVSYFARYGPPAPLEHLWSLAVEEQFYLIWPLILIVTLGVLRRPAHRALVAWAGALVSALIMLAVYVPGSDPSLVYYGTDTHASALMIGAALALTLPLARIAASAGRLRVWLDVAGAAGIVLLAWSMWQFSGGNPAVYPFGLVLAALAAGALVLAAAAPGRIGAALSARPLRWLGVRSYAIYLWHWPVIAISTGIDERAATTWPVRLLDTVLPIALAAASWRWLEEPILRNGFRPVLRQRTELLRESAQTCLRSPAAAVRVGVAVALLAVAGTAGYGLVYRQTGPTLQSQIAAGERVSSISRQGPVAGLAALRLSQLDPGWHQDGPLPVRPEGVPAVHRSRRLAPSGREVMAIGDSVMLASAPELTHALPGIYINAQVSRAMIAGVGIIQEMARAGRLRRVVIVGLGTNGPIALSQIEQLRAAIGEHRWLLLVNTFVPRPWEQEVNDTIVAAARRFPNVLMINWHNAIEHHTNLLWGDGIHPQPIGGVLYARIVRAVVDRALRVPPPVPARPSASTGFLEHASHATL